MILLALFVYRSLNLSGETPAVSEEKMWDVSTCSCYRVLVLANKASRKMKIL
jgi:hypothetical protein